MKRHVPVIVVAMLVAGSPALVASDDNLAFHEDYYLGFSQGVYYGLMLAGSDYEVAWCMKSELAYEAENLGTGGEFQAAMEAILTQCREEHLPAPE